MHRLSNLILAFSLAAALFTRAAEPADPAVDSYEMQLRQVQRSAQAKFTKEHDLPAALAELEKGARVLLEKYPGKAEPYEMLMEVAGESSSEKGRALAEEITKSAGPEKTKESARSLLRKLDAVGKPVDIRFTALDGRAVNVQEMKGKVILIDFWATWCGPCVAELPHVKAAYDKLHEKGLEIVGLSFDQEKSALENFVKEKQMPWPQYFDGKGWANRFGQQFGIQSIPAMWLVDKKGLLRELNARGDLEEKVTKLLAEE